MRSWWLAEKVVLITGGAGGIGAATVRELTRHGARPVLADLHRGGLASAAAPDVASAVDAGIGRHLPVGLPGGGRACAGRARTVEVNLLGAYHTIRAALPAVIEQRGYVA